MLKRLGARLRHPAFRPVLVGTVIVLGASLGFVSVLVQDAEQPTGYLPERSAVAKGHADRVLSYTELAARDGASRSLGRTGFQHLVEALPDLDDPVVRNDVAREAALRQRSSRRAYDGAPPIIPHAIDERDASSCLACHQRGMVMAGRVAPAMSHRPMSSCLQCHVVRETSVPAPVGPDVGDNSFESHGFGGPGKRAYAGAPPTMPHRRFMRENCASCHGISGHAGLRTTHPERLSCEQCHAPNSTRQQLPPMPGESLDQ